MSPTTRLERDFQAQLIAELKLRFPDCIVLKNDPNYIQGIPDLLILWGNRWAALECKASMTSRLQPNQSWYIIEMNTMSFASVICPENREEVLDALATTFGAAR
jgi:hypothetical protein